MSIVFPENSFAQFQVLDQIFAQITLEQRNTLRKTYKTFRLNGCDRVRTWEICNSTGLQMLNYFL